MNYRIAFYGASGTGKTTLATALADKLDLPVNPIGSRSVAREMGFDNPYDVDRAGKRAEFQRRLLGAKRGWEHERDAFVTDRTTLDNLAYTLLHDSSVVDDAYLDDVVRGLSRYTHLVFCPIASFIRTVDDPARVKVHAYHRCYEILVEGLVRQYRSQPRFEVYAKTLEDRREWLEELVGALRE